MSKFDAAIEELRWILDTTYLPSRQQEISDALRVLEAATKIADALELAARYGAERDEPEGTRFVHISDTLAKQLAKQLRGAALPDDTKCRHLSTSADKTERDIVTREWLRFQAGEIWSADTLDDAVDTLADTLTGFGIAVEDGKVGVTRRNIKGGE